MSFTPKFGWKKERPDFRDFHFGATHQAKELIDPPAVYDAREKFPDICNRIKTQVNQDCVFNAVALSIELLQIELFEQMKSNPFQFGLSVEAISRRFLYYNGREIDGTQMQDEGSYLRTGILTIRKTGMCRESVWPYMPDNLNIMPPIAAYKEAESHKVLTGFRVNHLDIEEIKKSVCLGFPVVFGATLYDSFMDIGSNGVVKMPSQLEGIQGGHAMTIVGYNDDIQMAVVANSWGKGCGDHGFLYMPYEYITGRYLCSDFWSLRLTA